MSIWEKYPNLSPQELRTLVNVTAQVLLDSADGTSTSSADLLAKSTAALSRELAPLLQEVEPSITLAQVRELLEDEDLSSRVCRETLDRVRDVPGLADRIAQAYELREQKLLVETVLLSGALVILAIKVKKIRSEDGKIVVTFGSAGEAVKAFVAGLVSSLGGPR
jgi:hypothetical protein